MRTSFRWGVQVRGLPFFDNTPLRPYDGNSPLLQGNPDDGPLISLTETEPSDSEDDEMLDFTERKNKKEMPVSVERRSPRAMKRDHHPDNPGAQEKRFEFMVGKKGRRLS